MPRPVRDRLPASLALVATVAAGLGLRAATGGAVAKYGGVALYATAVYATVLVVRPATRPAPATLVTVAACWAVELFQLTPVPAALSARDTLARLVLGSTFSPWDLLTYPAGALLGAAVHHVLTTRAQSGGTR